ncbi:MAG: acyl carrier protein [Terriglobales bacterium]
MPSEPQIDLSSIKNFIRTELIYDDEKDFDENTNLIERGIVDSMSLVRLISFLEENYEIQVQDEDIVPENFSSLAKISNFIAERRKRA